MPRPVRCLADHGCTPAQHSVCERLGGCILATYHDRQIVVPLRAPRVAAPEYRQPPPLPLEALEATLSTPGQIHEYDPRVVYASVMEGQIQQTGGTIAHVIRAGIDAGDFDLSDIAKGNVGVWQLVGNAAVEFTTKS